MNSIKKTDHYYLIDGSGYIFRAYYALPPLTRKSDGLPTGAVSGFCSMLYKLLEDAKSADNKDKPTHFAVVFDAARKNFRNDIYVDYKANRGEAPEDLIPQFEYFRKSVEAFNLPFIEMLNYGKALIDWILSKPSEFDASKIYLEGFSTNGKAANKIGTYLKALAARDNNVPFFVALPDSTIDWSIKDFKEDKVDFALFLSYRTCQIPQKCRAIIPSYYENGKVVYFGLDNTLDKEQKKLKIINCLEEIFNIYDKNKSQNKHNCNTSNEVKKCYGN